MTPKITRVIAKSNYKLQVYFKGAGSKVFDVKPYLSQGIFSELMNDSYFRKVRLVVGGVEWPHEQDLSADTLFQKGVLVKTKRKPPSKS